MIYSLAYQDAPIADPHKSTAGAAGEVVAMARGRVLVIDDEPDVVETLSDMLKVFGYDVASAGTFDEARAVMPTVRPHVVLLDLRMPGTPGLDGLSYLRQHHRTVPVIVVSSMAGQSDADAARAAGAFDVVTKPFDVEVLGQLVGQAMRVTRRE
jgi:DNA-binding response OmpR family regulator